MGSRIQFWLGFKHHSEFSGSSVSSHSKRGKGRRGDGGRVREGAAVWCWGGEAERNKSASRNKEKHSR